MHTASTSSGSPPRRAHVTSSSWTTDAGSRPPRRDSPGWIVPCIDTGPGWAGCKPVAWGIGSSAMARPHRVSLCVLPLAEGRGCDCSSPATTRPNPTPLRTWNWPRPRSAPSTPSSCPVIWSIPRTGRQTGSVRTPALGTMPRFGSSCRSCRAEHAAPLPTAGRTVVRHWCRTSPCIRPSATTRCLGSSDRAVVRSTPTGRSPVPDRGTPSPSAMCVSSPCSWHECGVGST